MILIKDAKIIQWGKSSVSPEMAGHLITSCISLNLYFILYIKIYSEWISDLKIRVKTVKPLEHMGVYFHDLGLGNSLLAMTPKAQATKGGKKQMNWTLSRLKTIVLQMKLSRK